MNLAAAIAIFLGAGCGALLRWTLGHWLNPLFPTLPLGTLSANVLGALLMGLLLGVFNQYESLSPTLRLALTTGFLGGLTTFSTFSAESATLLLRGEWRWFGLHTIGHVALSLAALFAGMAAMRGAFRILGGSA